MIKKLVTLAIYLKVESLRIIITTNFNLGPLIKKGTTSLAFVCVFTQLNMKYAKNPNLF